MDECPPYTRSRKQNNSWTASPSAQQLLTQPAPMNPALLLKPPLFQSPVLLLTSVLLIPSPPPATAPNDSWLRLGAKPKALVSSTPSCHKSRKLVGGRGRGDGPLLQPHYNYNIQLKNKYELLAPLFTSSAILGIGKKFTVTSFPPSLLLA